MLAYTYVERGKFALLNKPKPQLMEDGGCHCKGYPVQHLHQ